jgi:hypothetical protein
VLLLILYRLHFSYALLPQYPYRAMTTDIVHTNKGRGPLLHVRTSPAPHTYPHPFVRMPDPL